MKTVDAETAFALFFKLFKAHPWLNSAGTMTEQDEHAEAEALDFLLTANFANKWNGCSEPARRVVNGLLLDFMLKLQSPESVISRSSWEVSDGQPEWQQALQIIDIEIRRSHPRYAVRH